MDYKLGRLPENDEELYWAVRAMWNVHLPRHTCGDPTHTAPFQAFADAYFGRGEGIVLWHGSRGLSGKSYMLSILGITKAFLRGCDVNMLGGSLAQSANIHEHMRMAMNYKDAPQYLVEQEANTMIKLTNGARIRPLTASQKTVRGPHPPFLILDEIDEMDINILDAALGQPMPQKNYLNEIVEPFTVMCSTWQNPVGTFTEIRRRFEERDLPIVTWCYRCSANPIDGWLSQKTIDEKKRTIPTEMWRTEYELGEPAIGNRAFDPDAVEKTFSIPFEPISQNESKDFEEYIFEKPIAQGTYIAGADWAKEKDYTVITVVRTDKMPIKMVYYLRLNRRPYPVMIDYFNKAINDYSAYAIHDATGLGNVVDDYLDHRARKFLMVGAKRANMLSEYVNAVERGVYQFPNVKTAYISHKYCQVGDLYSSGNEFHLPDEVCALALVNHLVLKHVPAAAAIVLPKNNTPSKYALVLDPPRQYYQGTQQITDGEVINKTEREATEISFLA